MRDNIARLGKADSEAVYEAAKLAGSHDEILALPQGYDTEIGVAGMALSGGQRQRIALARAVYGGPKLVILDEPNSNLDSAGEISLLATLGRLQQRGETLVIIAHRPSVLANTDKVLVLRSGAVEMMGPRDQVFARLARPTAAVDAQGPNKRATRGSRGKAAKASPAASRPKAKSERKASGERKT